MKRALRLAVIGVATTAVAVLTTAAPSVAAPPTRLDQLKQRADAEIQRRLTTLQADSALVSKASHLSDSDRDALTSLITADQNGLTALKDTIDADTDLATARNDARRIVTDFRIYVLVEPQVHLTVAADRVSAIADRFADLDTKLQAKIDAAKQAGKDTGAEQQALDDAKANVADASTAASGVPSSVLALTPAGYPANRDTLVQARQDLETARTDLKTARNDVATVVQDLK